MRRAACFALSLSCVGCPSLGVHQTADTLPPGQWAAGGSLVVGQARDVEQDTRVPTAQAALMARRGLSRDVDVGANVHTFGADASVKWRFATSGEWAFAVLPTVGGARLRDTAVTTRSDNVFAQLPALATRRGRRPITLGAKAIYGLYRPEGGGQETGVSLGAFVNVDLPLGRRWHLQPELGAFRTLSGTVPLRGHVAWLGPALWKEW